MASTSDNADIPEFGRPAPIVRLFGWAVLGVLAAFMIENVLMVAFDFPGMTAAFTGGGALGWVPLLIYAAALAVAVAYVLRTPNRALRRESDTIHRFNLYLVRACFWIVLLVGVVDVTIAFMRVENLLDYFMGEASVRALSRATFVGNYVHIPLAVVGLIVALFTRTLGFTWLALLIVAAELIIVLSRFVFSYEQALMGDLVRYWYAALFLFASAYTLFDEGHVRVDVLYSGFSTRTRGIVNSVGSLLLGMTTAWVIIHIGFDGPRSIINSSVANMEISASGPVGMFIKYHMAAFLGIFAITMLIQFVSYFFEAVADRRDEPGHREHEPATQ